jgi:hypothetical protein
VKFVGGLIRPVLFAGFFLGAVFPTDAQQVPLEQMLYPSGGGFKMKVDGTSQPVGVERLR